MLDEFGQKLLKLWVHGDLEKEKTDVFQPGKKKSWKVAFDDTRIVDVRELSWYQTDLQHLQLVPSPSDTLRYAVMPCYANLAINVHVLCPDPRNK